LIASNFNQLSDLVKNLSNTLAKLGEDILQLGYDYQLLTKPFRASDSEYYGVVGGGQEAKQLERLVKVISIPANPEVKVKITSGVAHTKEARRDILMALRAGGDVSRQTLLENLDLDAEKEQDRLTEEQNTTSTTNATRYGGNGRNRPKHATTRGNAIRGVKGLWYN